MDALLHIITQKQEELRPEQYLYHLILLWFWSGIVLSLLRHCMELTPSYLCWACSKLASSLVLARPSLLLYLACSSLLLKLLATGEHIIEVRSNI